MIERPADDDPTAPPVDQAMRQAALVDALTHRLHNGPPLSSADEMAVEFLRRVLELA